MKSYKTTNKNERISEKQIVKLHYSGLSIASLVKMVAGGGVTEREARTRVEKAIYDEWMKDINRKRG